MTIFITELFKLDLSHLNIKFSEENSFFEKNLIKQYTFPFKVPPTRSFMPFFEFVSSHNSVESNKYVKGLLLRNDKYYEAELLIVGIKSEIEVVIYFSFDKLTIFNEPLKSLPWPTIDIGNNIFDFANSIKNLNYPNTDINFVQVYDPEKYKDYEYGYPIWNILTGISINPSVYINYCGDNGFSETDSNQSISGLASFMVEMRPFIYVKKIIEFIFEQIGYTIEGDFITDASINKALQYHDNSIFTTNNDLVRSDEIALSLAQSNISENYPGPLAYNEYIDELGVSSITASYTVKITVEGTLPNNILAQCKIYCSFNDEILASALAHNYGSFDDLDFTRELSFTVIVPTGGVLNSLTLKVECPAIVESTIIGEYEIKGTNRPLYSSTINLVDLLPDVSVGEYVNSVKESFSMSSIFEPTVQKVKINFYNSYINNQTAIDLSEFTIQNPSRKFSKVNGYRIAFSDSENIYINKKGAFVTSALDYEEKTIPIEPLAPILIDSVFHVKHQEELSLFFYEGNENALPLVNDGDILYTRLGFIHHFLRNWFYQNLNAEEYNITLDLPIYKALKIGTDSRLKLYNNFFSLHNLKREAKGLLFEKINMRLFKLKNITELPFGITDGPTGGNTTFSPPEIIIYTDYPIYQQTNNIVGQLYTGGEFGWNPWFVHAKIIAGNSIDPQGLNLSFGWELISSPSGDLTAQFIPDPNNSSTVTFKKFPGFVNITGDYIIRVTAVNTAGISNTLDVTVTIA